MDNLISIIIPVYNSREYLTETLESVRRQTYQNIEVLLVDDGSTDGSGQICDEYAKKDLRFRVFHLTNGGVAAARNYALDRASGGYCMFIDSDDLVKPEYAQIMMDAMIRTAASMVVCDHFSGRIGTADDFEATIIGNSTCREVALSTYRFSDRNAHHTVWGGLYSRSLIGEQRFVLDLYVGEDTLFFAQLLKKAGKYTYVNSKLYYYRFVDTSISHAAYNVKQSTEILAWERVCNLFSDESREFLNECYATLWIVCRKNYERALEAETVDKGVLRSIHRKCIKYQKYAFRSDFFTLRNKLNIACFLCAPRLFYALRRVLVAGRAELPH